MKNLIEITKEKFDVELDIRYAGHNNLTGAPIYNQPICFLHPDGAEHLKKSIELAKEQGFKIKIWDCFRPFVIQENLWSRFINFPGLFSDPKTGSVPHCRGIAIDLTLIDEKGNELDMGTDFDDTTNLAHHDCHEVSEQAQKNRLILKEIMQNSGWDFYPLEWWHYQLFNPRNYPVIK